MFLPRLLRRLFLRLTRRYRRRSYVDLALHAYRGGGEIVPPDPNSQLEHYILIGGENGLVNEPVTATCQAWMCPTNGHPTVRART